MPWRPFFSALSPAGARARLSILIFHRVAERPDPLFPDRLDAERFDDVLQWVGRWFNVLALDVAVQRLVEQRLPPRAMAITFDDGYADNHDVALPVLRRHGMPATFFIATAFVDGGRMWNDTVVEAIRATPQTALDVASLDVDGLPTVLPLASVAERRRAIATTLAAVKYLPPARRLDVVDAFARLAGVRLPTDLMMSSAQVRALDAAGMQVGAHTHTHPILARLDDGAARDEIALSRDTLQALLQKPVTLFAYPNGKPGHDFTPANVEAVRALGFSAAVTTAPGAARTSTDPLQIPRFTPWDRTRWRYGARLVRNLF